ncbi:MFS transporter [Desulfosoma caldarium]|uniref:Putative MFS family arabinose efflux permease n=1 Tax=Desulfosoma caldarium TaxID=610254 RepID=A0A3N1ULG5_9BACT|nr:MFS transporter [Desulfosoma caldarium]ROQ90239.1 putative MFS family arabinose efflux permease [Desulfosoma caldarium]
MKPGTGVVLTFPFSARIMTFPLCGFLYTAVLWMMFSFLPLHLKSRGFSDGMVGMIMGFYSISALILMIPLGVLSDRVSPKKVLVGGAVLLFIHMAGLRIAEAWYAFLALAVLGGLSWAIFQTVLLALFLKIISPARRGVKIAVYQMGSYLGFGIGPLVSGSLWGDANYVRMLGFAVAGAALLIVLVLTLQDSDPIRFNLGDYREDLKQPRALVFLVVWLLYATHFGVEQTSYTLLMRHDLGFTSVQVGLSYLAVGLWMAAMAPATGRGFDVRQSVVWLLTLGLVVSSVFQSLTAYAQTLPQMIAVRVLHTTGDVPVILAMGIMTAAFFPQGRLGGHSAVVYAVRTLGVFVGNYAAGLVIPVLGYRGAFVASGVVVLVGSLALLPWIRRVLHMQAPSS